MWVPHRQSRSPAATNLRSSLALPPLLFTADIDLDTTTMLTNRFSSPSPHNPLPFPFYANQAPSPRTALFHSISHRLSPIRLYPGTRSFRAGKRIEVIEKDELY